MKAEETLFAALIADPGIDAIVGPRVYPDARPAESGTLPAIVYQRTDTETIQGLSGAVLASRGLLQVACLAKLRSAAEELADAVIAVAQAEAWIIVARIAAFEPESEIYVAAVDVQIQE